MKIFYFSVLFYSLNINAQTLPSTTGIQEDKVLPGVSLEESKKIPGDDVIPNIELSNVINKVQNSINITEVKSKSIIKAGQISYMKKQAKNIPKSIPKKVLIIGEDGIANSATEEAQKLEALNEAIPPQPISTQDEIKTSQSSVENGLKTSFEDKGDGIRVFTRNINNYQGTENDTVTLPSGSTAKATLLGGVELTNEERSIDAKLDSIFLGPNQAVVEMNGCIVWVKLRANFNNERLYGKGYTLSCRSESGKTFELPLLAHVKGEDAYLGIKGELLANGKMKAAVAGFLQEGITGYGNAVAKSQTTTSVVASGGDSGSTASAENVTGSESKYILGKAVSSAANNRFLNWYQDFYSSLAPTIAVPVGTPLYLSVEGEVQIPKEFFKNSKTRINTESEFYKVKIERGEKE